MDTATLKTTVYARLEAIASAEKITREELKQLSRELLEYVPNTDDIDIVNRLVNVLTPVNRKVAIAYFTHFLPWTVEKNADGDFSRFGKRMQGDKKIAKRMELITEALADEEFNIWTWADVNIEVKQKNLFADVQRAVEKALKGHEKSDTPPLSPAEVVNAVFAGGVTLDDLMTAVARQVEDQQKAAEEAASSMLSAASATNNDNVVEAAA